MERMKQFSFFDKNATDCVILERDISSQNNDEPSSSTLCYDQEIHRDFISKMTVSSDESNNLVDYMNRRPSIERYEHSDDWKERKECIIANATHEPYLNMVSTFIDRFNNEAILLRPNLNLKLDESAQRRLHPAVKNHYKVFNTSGGGNCFFNSVSIDIIGNESLSDFLRSLTVFSIVNYYEKFCNFEISLLQSLDLQLEHK